MEQQYQNYGVNKQSDLFSEQNIRLLVIAPSGSGKSVLIQQIIENPNYGLNNRFKGDQIFCFSPTMKVDPSQIQLQKYIKNMPTCEGFKYDEEAQTFQKNIIQSMMNLYESQIDILERERAQNKEDQHRELLFIVDDCQGLLDQKQFEQLMVKIRHSQEYKRSCSVTARTQFNMLIIGGLSNYKDIQKITEELSGNNKKIFQQIFQDATKERYQFLLIMQNLSPQYRYFKIEDVKNNKIIQYQI